MLPTLAGIGSRILGLGWYGCTTVERWFAGFNGGIVSNVEEILEMHKIATQSCFGTRSFVKKEDPKQPSGKVHIKACIAELYNCKDCYKDCH